MTDEGLFLSYGTPGHVWVDRSIDCGASWTNEEQIDLPTTTGYTGLAHVQDDLMVFTDAESETQIRGYRVPKRSL